MDGCRWPGLDAIGCLKNRHPTGNYLKLMNTNISRLTTIAVLASALPFTAEAAPQVYDLKADWSDTQNPNGAWEYGQGFPPVLLSNDPFPWVGWAGNTVLSRTTDADHVPGVLEVGDIYGITNGDNLWIGWTAPEDGSIDISGAIWNTRHRVGE